MFKRLRDKAKSVIEKIGTFIEASAEAIEGFDCDFDCDFD